MSARATTTAVALAIVAFAAARGDRRVIAYVLVVAAGAAVVAAIHRRRPGVLTPRLTTALIACAALHLAGGLLPGHPVFYETWIVEHVLKFDQLVHFTITATLTVFARRLTGSTPKAIVLALAAGVGNEVFEALSSLRFADAYVGGFTNAGWDLVFDAFGAATAAALATGSYVGDSSTRSPAACASHVANMSA
jgi:hypothetical protein